MNYYINIGGELYKVSTWLQSVNIKNNIFITNTLCVCAVTALNMQWPLCVGRGIMAQQESTKGCRAIIAVLMESPVMNLCNFAIHWNSSAQSK